MSAPPHNFVYILRRSPRFPAPPRAPSAKDFLASPRGRMALMGASRPVEEEQNNAGSGPGGGGFKCTVEQAGGGGARHGATRFVSSRTGSSTYLIILVASQGVRWKASRGV